jgi:hypothetical protein
MSRRDVQNVGKREGGSVTTRTPVLLMDATNGGVFGDPETAVWICAPLCEMTKKTVSAGPLSAGFVGAGVNVKVPVQSEFTE